MDAANSMILQLLDRQQIGELLHRYCFALYHGTVEDVMALFASQCSVRLIPGQVFEERAGVEAFYKRLIGHRMNLVRHTVHNLVIELTGHTATVKSYWDVKGDLRGEAVVLGGYYDDCLNKSSGRWLFSERQIRMEFAATLAQGWGGEPKLKIKAV
jgi:ketosteroid isomerase-like protein